MKHASIRMDIENLALPIQMAGSGKKHSMIFLWIASYGLVYALANCLPREECPWAVPLAMFGYSASLILWIFHTGQARRLGLCVPRHIRCFRFFPLLILPVCNVLIAETLSLSFPTFLLMVATCAAEELFFRGFLLRFLMRYGAIPAVLSSSAVFALLHLVNLTAGSALYTLAQVLSAFAAGICFAAAAVLSGSLLPGFAAHFLSNITAVPVSSDPPPLLWLCITLYCCYGAVLCKTISVNKERVT